MTTDDPITMRTHDHDSRPAPRGRSGGFWMVLIFGAIGLLLLFMIMAVISTIGSVFLPSQLGDLEERLVEGDPADGDKLLLLPVTGVIMDGDAGIFGAAVTTPWSIRRALELAREDDAIRGVLLVVNSPGGGVTASDTILDELRRYKTDSGLPIVAHFQDVAASGGYYVSMAADEIVAHPTTITGSIGVIMRMLNYRGLYEKLGLSENTIVSDDTPMKDMGSPTREMRPEERARLESIVQEMYDRFVDVVDAGRANLERERVKTLANGSIYSAGQALEGGLVDALGYRHDALAKLRERAGVSEDVAVITYQEPPSILEAMLMKASPGARLEERFANTMTERLFPAGSGMLYLWPGWNQP